MAKVQKSTDSASLAEVVDRILDKGIVVDAFAKVSLVGIELVSIEGATTAAAARRERCTSSTILPCARRDPEPPIRRRAACVRSQPPTRRRLLATCATQGQVYHQWKICVPTHSALLPFVAQ